MTAPVARRALVAWLETVVAGFEAGAARRAPGTVEGPLAEAGTPVGAPLRVGPRATAVLGPLAVARPVAEAWPVAEARPRARARGAVGSGRPRRPRVAGLPLAPGGTGGAALPIRRSGIEIGARPVRPESAGARPTRARPVGPESAGTAA